MNTKEMDEQARNRVFHLAQSFDQVSKKIAQAALRSGRRKEEVNLIAVSKGVDTETLQAAIQLGINQFGENRIQEAMTKFRGISPGRNNVSLHMVGTLQTNKVKKAVGFFELIHSVDSLPLAKKISEEAERQAMVQPILAQVNIGEEETKGGVSIQEAPSFVEAVRRFSSLRLLGLMAIPPEGCQNEASRPYFSLLREIGSSLGLNQFSMGMSGDFEVAIEEGATWVRIGTALFGPARFNRSPQR